MSRPRSSRRSATVKIQFRSLSRNKHKVHFRIAEYVTLIAAADMTGHHAVGVVLETCLADKMAFVERTRRLIRNIVEVKIAEKMATKMAAA